MCGFAGFIDVRGVDQAQAEDFTGRVSEVLKHRGPDSFGRWIDAQSGVVLAHRRLSIVDISDAGLQPMESASKRYIICFNGEIYNHKQLRSEIDQEPHGFHWRGHSDTETLLACIETFGLAKSLKKMDGMFAFCLWDKETRCICLARDRVGEKPLYFGQVGKAWFFSSELKAFHSHPDFLAKIDRHALSAYMKNSCVPGTQSIFEGISKINPGTYVQINAQSGQITTNTFWSLNETIQKKYGNLVDENPRQSLNEHLSSLETVLGDAVEKQMQADVPLGAFLSGGVDSSLIVSLMGERSTQKIKTFSVGFEDKDYNEAIYAEKVSKHLNTEHYQMNVSDREAIDVIPSLPHIFDEPFSDSSQIPTYLVSKIAKQNVKVALTGDGGDELFGGYNRYTLGASVWTKFSYLPHPLRQVIAKAFLSVPSHILELVLASFFASLPDKFKHRQMAGKLDKLNKVLCSNSSQDLYHNLTSQWNQPEELVLGINSYLPQNISSADNLKDLSVASQMMYWDFHRYLPDDILVKVDRSGMASSLETRMPFLDPKVIDLAWQLPVDMKIKNGQGKVCLKELLYKRVPKKLIERPKMGFGVPIGDWLRGPLRDWAENLLETRRLKSGGFFNVLLVRKKWEDHLSGRADWGHELWSVLMFEAWSNKWLAKNRVQL